MRRQSQPPISTRPAFRLGEAVAEEHDEDHDEVALILAMLVRFIESALAQGRESRAVLALARRTRTEIATLARAASGELRVTFTDEAIFVQGEPIQAAREIYAPALELGRLFARQGVIELGFRADLEPDALLALADFLASAIRDPDLPDAPREAIIGITLRAGPALPSVDPADPVDPVDPADRALDIYLAGLATLRDFHAQLASGATPGLRGLKRLAQALVTVHELGDGLLLGLTAFATVHRDDAGRALQAAVLCISAAAQLTQARLPLSRLAFAALLSGAGRARLSPLADGAPRFPEALDAAVPATSAAVSVAAGAVHRSSALRTATLWEASWLAREAKLGPLYAGRRAPLWQSRILRASRAFLDRLAPRGGARSASPLEALEELARPEGADREALRLLVKALSTDPLPA